jgi:hypothetical protein
MSGTITTPNPIWDLDMDGQIISGSVYAITASGTFNMERSFTAIPLETTNTISSIDVISAIQINILAADINSLLSISGGALSTTYDSVTGKFSTGGSITDDKLTISGTNLANWLTLPSQIHSTGKYAKLYSEFKSFVATYFGLPGNFASLYDDSGQLSFTEGTYIASDVPVSPSVVGDLKPIGLYNLMKTVTPASTAAGGGGAVSIMGGSITISDISKLLRFAVDTNVFNNRLAKPASGTDLEVNYGVGNGFIAGDLIYIGTGATAKLTVGLTLELDTTPMNIIKSSTSSGGADNYTFSTSGTPSLLTRTLIAPILLRIV